MNRISYPSGCRTIICMVQIFYTTLLKTIFGADLAVEVATRLENLVEWYRGQIQMPASRSLSEHDSILITYGDQVRQTGKPPLQSLEEFCVAYLKGVVSGIHILPFYCVIRTIDNQAFKIQFSYQPRRLRNVMPPTICQAKAQRISQSIHAHMDFGAEPTSDATWRLFALASVFLEASAAHG